MIVVAHLAVAFGLSLLMAWIVDALRHGRELYWPAAVGVAAAMVAFLGDGYMLPVVVLVLRWGGLVLAAGVLVFDLLTEEIPEEELPEGPSGAPPATSG
jgi:hypothetical protein